MPGAVAPMAQGATDFVVHTEWVPRRASIHLIGELDLAALPALDSTVESVLSIQPTPRVVQFDLSGVRFLDVLGARALLAARARVSRVARADLTGGRPRVMDVLEFVERVSGQPLRPFRHGEPANGTNGQRSAVGAGWGP